MSIEEPETFITDMFFDIFSVIIDKINAKRLHPTVPFKGHSVPTLNDNYNYNTLANKKGKL